MVHTRASEGKEQKRVLRPAVRMSHAPQIPVATIHNSVTRNPIAAPIAIRSTSSTRGRKRMNPDSFRMTSQGCDGFVCRLTIAALGFRSSV